MNFFFESSNSIGVIPITRGKNAQTILSLNVPAAAPTLKSSRRVLAMYFASIGFALVRSSAVNFNAISCAVTEVPTLEPNIIPRL